MRFRAVVALSTTLAVSLAVPAVGQEPSRSVLRVVVVEGEGAINNIREQRAKEPVVRVTDAEFRAVAGASVTFMTPELGASASFPSGSVFTTTSDARGEAVGRGLRPNNVVGPFQIRVTAVYRGQTAAAVINQTNAAPAAVRGGSGKKVAVVLIILGGGAAGASLALIRKQSATGGGPTQPTTPATAITAGTGSFGKP